MGGILSKILGSKTTLRERLEKVDKELRNIQRFQVDTQLYQKRLIGRLMIASSFIYFISAVSVYFFGPSGSSWKSTALYLLPFIIFPFLIWGLNRGIAWYYKRRIGNNTDKYKELKTERQRLLEDVMEYETFNNAKEILEKYDPTRLLPKYLAEQRLNTPSTSPVITPITSRTPDIQDTLRRRNLQFGQPPGTMRSQTPLMRPMLGTQGQFLRQTTNMPFQLMQRPAIMPAGMSSLPRPHSAPPPPHFMPQGPRPGPMFITPQPPGNPTLHNRRMGWMDKLVDYVVSDGPAHRYALICKYCATHNGLATPEDFPFIGYRCVFCRQYNPPRQVKPAAEKLPLNTVLIEEIMESDRTELTSTQSTPSNSPRGVDESSQGIAADKPMPTNGSTESDAEGRKAEGGEEAPRTELSDKDGEEEAQPPTLAESEEPGAAGESGESLSSSETEPFEFVDSDASSSTLPEARLAEFVKLESLPDATGDLHESLS